MRVSPTQALIIVAILMGLIISLTNRDVYEPFGFCTSRQKWVSQPPVAQPIQPPVFSPIEPPMISPAAQQPSQPSQPRQPVFSPIQPPVNSQVDPRAPGQTVKPQLLTSDQVWGYIDDMTAEERDTFTFPIYLFIMGGCTPAGERNVEALTAYYKRELAEYIPKFFWGQATFNPDQDLVVIPIPMSEVEEYADSIRCVVVNGATKTHCPQADLGNEESIMKYLRNHPVYSKYVERRPSGQYKLVNLPRTKMKKARVWTGQRYEETGQSYPVFYQAFQIPKDSTCTYGGYASVGGLEVTGQGTDLIIVSESVRTLLHEAMHTHGCSHSGKEVAAVARTDPPLDTTDHVGDLTSVQGYSNAYFLTPLHGFMIGILQPLREIEIPPNFASVGTEMEVELPNMFVTRRNFLLIKFPVYKPGWGGNFNENLEISISYYPPTMKEETGKINYNINAAWMDMVNIHRHPILQNENTGGLDIDKTKTMMIGQLRNTRNDVYRSRLFLTQGTGADANRWSLSATQCPLQIEIRRLGTRNTGRYTKEIIGVKVVRL